MLRVSGRNFGVAGEEQSRSFVTNRQSRKCPRDTSRKYQFFLNDSIVQDKKISLTGLFQPGLYILCTAENLTIDCEDFENWFVF